MKKVYFPNLNGLRFIAAFMVIIHHIEQLKEGMGVPNYFKIPCIFFIGKLGVILFFVLSGFLITYLLLKEKESSSTISIKQFYMRRILRIWPLYFLLITLGLFVLPHFQLFQLEGRSELVTQNILPKVVLFGLFLPNVVLILYQAIPFISHTWSIGVEEQFYILWPILIKKFKNIFKVLFGVIIVYFVFRVIILVLDSMFSGNYFIHKSNSFWGTFSIDCMALGGLFATILFYKKDKLLSFIFSKYFQFTLYLVCFSLMAIGFHAPTVVHYEFYAVLFGLVIINLAANPKSIISLEHKVLNYLGTISYGLYMYHIIAIVLALRIVQYFHFNNFVIYPFTLLFVILIASTSYELFEKRFIRLKRKFTIIQSGE